MAKITGNGIIKRFMRSLDKTTDSGETALDAAVRYASNGYFSGLTNAINKMVDDCRSLGADKFLLKKCGINLSTSDTGAITGYDAGGSKVKTKASIVPESGSLNTSFKSASFTTKTGLTFRLEKTSLSKDEAYMWRALKTWWADASLNLIKNSYGYTFNDGDAISKDITVKFENSSGGWLAYTDNPKDINGHYSMTLAINKNYFKDFSSSDVNGESPKNSVYLDRIIAHELTHAIMMAKVENYSKLPVFITEGLAELTQGIDDLRAKTIRSLAEDSSKLKNYLTMTSSGAYAYTAGYIFLRYLAKQASEHYPQINSYDITVKGSVLTVPKNYDGGSVVLSDYSSSVKIVDASAFTKGIMITGNTNANSILAGSGNDTLSGGDGKDSLTGGKGKDVFIYSNGDDVITDYSAGDKISVGSAISLTTVSGSDVIFMTRKGTLTVKNAKNKSLSLIDSSGNEYSEKFDGRTLKITNVTSSPVTVGTAVKVIDASSRTKTIEITGTSKDNTIIGGSKNDSLYGASGNDSLVGNAGADKIYGGKGNDTLWGGKGHDVLWGEAGADIFVYTSGDGNDVIYGFGNKDTLTLDNIEFTSATYSKKNEAVTFKFADGGSIKLKEFTATSFHINNDVYKISGTSLVKK